VSCFCTILKFSSRFLEALVNSVCPPSVSCHIAIHSARKLRRAARNHSTHCRTPPAPCHPPSQHLVEIANVVKTAHVLQHLVCSSSRSHVKPSPIRRPCVGSTRHSERRPRPVEPTKNLGHVAASAAAAAERHHAHLSLRLL
jgi:hypothetical protein